MPSLIDDLVGDLSLSEGMRRDLEGYVDQGGMLGLLAYVFVALETDDDALAANVAAQLAVLFVASSLHDDAVDEAPSADRKRFLNERITVGDLAFTRLVDLVDELPAEAESVTGPIREIGRGQLAEESVSAGGSRPDAIDRLDARGSVWGRLLGALVGATDCHRPGQVDRIETIATNLVFVYTVFDDVEDLREDVENGVANAPVLLLEDADGPSSPGGPPGAGADASFDDLAADPDATVESVVDSDVPRELEALVERRRARLDDACRAFYDAGGYRAATVVDAMDRGLAWYCESVCTTPVAATVSPDLRRDVRRKLEGDAETRRRFLESTFEDAPLPTPIFPEADAIVEELPAERLAPVCFRLLHVDALARERLTTSLKEALASLRGSA